jgi:hypothetical protein
MAWPEHLLEQHVELVPDSASNERANARHNPIPQRLRVQQARMLSLCVFLALVDESFCHVDHVDPLQASEIVCV